MTMKKRTAACVALAALVLCLFVAPTFAEQTERKVMLGTSGLAHYDSVYLGSHGGDGFGCMMEHLCNSGTAVKWHVIPLNVFTDQNSDKTKLALFSQCVFSEWSEGASYVWPMSSVGDANAFVQMLPEKMFTGVERSAVPSLSSPNPFYNYADRVPSNIAGIGVEYWSDSEQYDNYQRGMYFDEYGTMYTEDDKNYSAYAGARPWGALNDESVLFISKAPGGKSLENAGTGFVSTAKQEGEDIDTWRLTLKDETRSNFGVEWASIDDEQKAVWVRYKDATVGDNEYVSAIITDANGDVLYYGRLDRCNGIGTASTKLAYPSGVTPSRDYKMYVFSEQYNGGSNDQGFQTDYASELIPIYSFVTFDTQGNGSAPDEQIVGYGQYAKEPANPEAQGKIFGGWFKDAACTQAWDFNNDAVTEDITLYAKWGKEIDFSLTANGSDTESTTELTLTFDKDVDNLTTDDITLTGADKGELTKISGKTYTLSIFNITVADKGIITVKVETSEFGFTADSRTVQVRKHLPPAEVTVAPMAKSGLTYIAQAQPLVNAGTAVGGTMHYSLEEDGGYSTDIPTGTDAKEYTVYYKAVGDENHRDSAVGSVFVSIAKATPNLGTISHTGTLYADTPGSSVTLTRTNTIVPGTLKLLTPVLTAGENEYAWQFVPADTANYNTVTGTVLLNVLDHELQSLTISGTLQKSAYTYGDVFSPAGLTIKANYSNGTTLDVTSSVSYETSLEVGQTSVALNYGGKTCAVQITVDKAYLFPQNGTLNVANNQKKTYTYDLSQLLPALDGGRTYGGVSYQLGAISLGSHYAGGASISGATLSLPIEAVRGSGVDLGTVSVSITSGNYAFTADAVIAVKEGAQVPQIEEQPVSASYLQGDQNAHLKVKAKVTDGGRLTYQWYSNTVRSHVGGTPISGADGANYKPSTEAVGTVYYYCVVTNTNDKAAGEKTASAASDVATVTVLSAAAAHDADITIIGQPDTAYDSVRARLMPLGSTAPLYDRELTAAAGTSPVQYLYRERAADGLYNLVITAEEANSHKTVTVTALIDLQGRDDKHDVRLPEADKSSAVEDDTGMGIIAGSVEDAASDQALADPKGHLEVMLAAKPGYDPQTAAQDAPRIEQQAGEDRKEIEVVLDIDLTLHQFDADGREISETNLGSRNKTHLEILIPIRTAGRAPEGFAVYRVHNGELQKLPYGAGDEYFTVDIGGAFIKLCVKRFSSYAIGYGEPAPQEIPDLPKTGDDSQSAVWIAMCLFSIAGMFAVSKQSRKRRME